MDLTLPSETIFHSIESAIKAYRKFSQQNISAKIEGITLDQSLALIYIDKYAGFNQNALAEILFKDNASLTRMINTMVKNGFIERAMNPEDLRRYKLVLTKKGKQVTESLPTVIENNRRIALSGISKSEEESLFKILEKLRNNCTKPSL